MEAGQAECGRLCTSVQVLVNLVETRNRYIGDRLFGRCVLRRKNNKEKQRTGKSVHRIHFR